jgi:hypothetical protein
VFADEGPQQATVRFQTPTADGGSPIQFYTVRAYPGGVPTQTTSSPVTIKNLTAGTPYTFTVTATNRAGESSAPSPSAIPYRLPGPPVITRATAGNARVTVEFTPSKADQQLGNPIFCYTVTARPGVNVTTGPGITANGNAARSPSTGSRTASTTR